MLRLSLPYNRQQMTPSRFRTLVLAHYKKHGRHDLPWRKTQDPYRILVSEIMLQQTQVERVIPYYERFLKVFPDAPVLARAPLSKVLTLWQGLGYNRRAKMLHEAAKVAIREYNGRVPKTVEKLRTLPGVGPYTAGAVAAFSGNADAVFIETNIRTAVTYHFFSDQKTVTDAEVLAVLANALPKGRAREWYSALMDYGAHLKRSGVRINAKANGYTKQSVFKGSSREARGAILKALANGSKEKQTLCTVLGKDRAVQVTAQLAALQKEGLIRNTGSRYRLAS